MAEKLRQWNETKSNMFRFWSIGTSTGGAQIWACEISTTLGDQTVFKPNVKYIGNMHGDEVVGRELLMRFMQTLLEGNDPDANALLESANVFVIPTMNPDGFARGVRVNNNGVDLNRNFPDQYRQTGNPERETQLIMTFLKTRQWTLSANFHGGDLVANYPWDGRPDNIWSGENKCPDDDTFRYISYGYSRTNPGMMGRSAPSFHNGTTNGAAWYVLFGGMQDFNYIHHGCLEITLEVSMNKWPAGSELTGFWNQNKVSMFNYLSLVNTGVRGRVYDRDTQKPIAGAQVVVVGREISKVISRTENGAYFRILPPSTTVTLEISAPGYRTITVPVTTPDAESRRSPSGFQNKAFVNLDVLMVRGSAAPVHAAVPAKPAPISTSPIASPNIIEAPESDDSKSVGGAVKQAFPLLSSTDGWAAPMIGVAAAFAAVVAVLFVYTIIQSRRTSHAYGLTQVAE